MYLPKDQTTSTITFRGKDSVGKTPALFKLTDKMWQTSLLQQTYQPQHGQESPVKAKRQSHTKVPGRLIPK